jgi:DNA adenine methylase
MTIGALAPWYGCKRTLGPKIVFHINPKCDFFFSGFCGSGAVELLVDWPRMQVWNDLNADIHNLIKVLQSSSLRAELQDRLKFTFAEERQFFESREKFFSRRPIIIPDLDHAFHSLCYWWLGINGYAGIATKSNTGYARRFGPNGGTHSVRWNSFKDSIDFIAERLKEVDFWSKDIGDVLPKIQDLEGTSIYLDPPYLRKSDEYAHDFAAIWESQTDGLFGKNDERMTHQKLAEMAGRFERAQVLISYYEEPEIDLLYPPERWDKIDLATKKNLGNSTGSTEKVAPEILLINRRSVPS